ncbi:MAG: hypothetical protein R3E32_21370 [Chitinophagales bacterium]
MATVETERDESPICIEGNVDGDFSLTSGGFRNPPLVSIIQHPLQLPRKNLPIRRIKQT